VIQLVRSWIDTAELKEGDRLPTERALAEQFSLNRNLVRRAFQQLDRMGLINRHVGVAPSLARAATETMRGAVRSADYSPAAVLQTRLMSSRDRRTGGRHATMSDLKALEALIGRRPRSRPAIGSRRSGSPSGRPWLRQPITT